MDWTIHQGDALTVLKTMPDKSVHCCVTSPPYWGLRDYGVPGQLGLEQTPEEYVNRLVEIFREVWRVLRDDGTLWLVLGSCYAGSGKGCGGSYEKERKAYSTLKEVFKDREIGTSIMGKSNEPFILRDNLTVDEIAYVMSELAHFIKGDKVT